VRTTLTLDDDVAALLEKENSRANEPMKQTVNRALRSGLLQAANPTKPKRFVVKPFDTGLTSEQWKAWGETKLEDIMEQAEMPPAR
jgi:hypothetical protein